MGKVNEYSVQLLEDWGDSVDIHYTQFLEVAFFLKVPATQNMSKYFSDLLGRFLEWSFQRTADKLSRRKNESN